MTKQEEIEQEMLHRHTEREEKVSKDYNNILYKHNDKPVTIVKRSEHYNPSYDRKTARVVMYTDKREEVLEYISSFHQKYALDYNKIRKSLHDNSNVFLPQWDCYVKFRYEE